MAVHTENAFEPATTAGYSDGNVAKLTAAAAMLATLWCLYEGTWNGGTAGCTPVAANCFALLLSDNACAGAGGAPRRDPTTTSKGTCAPSPYGAGCGALKGRAADTALGEVLSEWEVAMPHGNGDGDGDGDGPQKRLRERQNGRQTTERQRERDRMAETERQRQRQGQAERREVKNGGGGVAAGECMPAERERERHTHTHAPRAMESRLEQRQRRRWE